MRRLIVSLALFLASLGSQTAPASAIETAVFAEPGTISLAVAPYVFAQELGFFQDDNMQLDVVVLRGSGEIIPQLIKGTILTSMITPDLLITSHQPGRPNFPIRFTYNVFRRSIWQMVVLDGSQIHSLQDLSGKTIGVGALTFANVVQTKALLRRNGVDPSSVNFVAVGTGGAAAEALRRGEIDVLNLYEAAHAGIEAQGIKLRHLDYPPEFSEVSSHGLAFSDSMINARPDLVIRFGRALAKGTIACQANLDGCLDAYWKAYPDMKPKPLTDVARARERGILGLYIVSMTTFRKGEPHQLGSYSQGDWTVTINSLRSGGEISADLDPQSFYTAKFVDDFNRFDQSDIIRRAQAYEKKP